MRSKGSTAVGSKNARLSIMGIVVRITVEPHKGTGARKEGLRDKGSHKD